MDDQGKSRFDSVAVIDWRLKVNLQRTNQRGMTIRRHGGCEALVGMIMLNVD